MEVRLIILICIVAGIILFAVYSFENAINKKIDRINDKIDTIGYQTNDIDPYYYDLYTKLTSIQQQIKDLTPNIENTNEYEPESEK